MLKDRSQKFSLPRNSFCERSENWLMPYWADHGVAENEFRYTCRLVAFCNDTHGRRMMKIAEGAAK